LRMAPRPTAERAVANRAGLAATSGGALEAGLPAGAVEEAERAARVIAGPVCVGVARYGAPAGG